MPADQTTTDEIPLFPAPALPVLADPASADALVQPVLASLADLVAVIGPDDLARPTPCRDYDVAALRDHVLGWLDFFGAAFAAPGRSAERPDPGAFRAADLPAGTGPDVVRRAAERIGTALAAGVLDGEVVLSQARMSGPAALGMVLGEYVVHGWDLARALRRPWVPAEAAVTAAHEFFRGVVAPEYRGEDSGFFGAEVPVPADADPLTRLLGFAGRTPDPGPTAVTSR